jgi:hypothetical protein
LKKTINGRQADKKQTDKETTLEKTINRRQPFKTRTRRKPWAKTMDRETTL